MLELVQSEETSARASRPELPRFNRPETPTTPLPSEGGLGTWLVGLYRKHRHPVNAAVLGAVSLPGLTGAAVATVNTTATPADPALLDPTSGGAIGICNEAFGTRNPTKAITDLPTNVQNLARWMDETLGDGDGQLSARELRGFVGRSGTAGNSTTGPVAELVRVFANSVARDLTLSGPVPLETTSLELARSMTHAGGTSTAADVELVVKELARVPAIVLERAKDKGITVVSSRETVTDHLPGLHDVTPRGWPAGTTWSDVPGLYHPPTREVVVSIHDDGSGGRCVPPATSGHGSDNLVLHEFAHALDYRKVFRSIHASSNKFGAAYQADLARLGAGTDRYLVQGGDAGREEAFAESFSRYFSRDPKLASDWPGLHAFWQSFETEQLSPR